VQTGRTGDSGRSQARGTASGPSRGSWKAPVVFPRRDEKDRSLLTYDSSVLQHRSWPGGVRATAGRRIRSVVEFMVLMEQLRRHQRTHSCARARHHNARQTDGSAICCSSRQIWRCVMACRRHRCRANGARRGGMPLPMASVTSWLVRAPIPLGHQWTWTYAKLGSRSTNLLSR
jgi:hypothetical protein